MLNFMMVVSLLFLSVLVFNRILDSLVLFINRLFGYFKVIIWSVLVVLLMVFVSVIVDNSGNLLICFGGVGLIKSRLVKRLLYGDF